jgi:hypothetical protein
MGNNEPTVKVFFMISLSVKSAKDRGDALITKERHSVANVVGADSVSTMRGSTNAKNARR